MFNCLFASLNKCTVLFIRDKLKQFNFILITANVPNDLRLFSECTLNESIFECHKIKSS